MTGIVRRHLRTRVDIGNHVHFDRNVRLVLHEGASISIGDHVYINEDVRIEALEQVSIGSRCLLGMGTMIIDSDLHTIDGVVNTGPVVIEDHVWTGMRTLILPGVHIGSGALVAAGAVVTRDVAQGTLVAGVPARVIRTNVHWDPRR